MLAAQPCQNKWQASHEVQHASCGTDAIAPKAGAEHEAENPREKKKPHVEAETCITLDAREATTEVRGNVLPDGKPCTCESRIADLASLSPHLGLDATSPEEPSTQFSPSQKCSAEAPSSTVPSMHSADEQLREYLRKHNWPEYLVPCSSIEKFELTETDFNEEGDILEIELDHAYNRAIEAYNVTWEKRLRVRVLKHDIIIESGIKAGSAHYLKGLKLAVSILKRRKQQQLIFVLKPPLLPSIAIPLHTSHFELEAWDAHSNDIHKNDISSTL